MNCIYPLLFLFFCISSCLVPDEIDGLTRLYHHLNGADWKHRDNWLSGDPCKAGWFGVVCNDDGSHVLGIYLGNNNMRGELPKEIGVFSKLIYLDFNGNSISGALPDSFSKLVDLQAVGMTYNNLEGHLPEDFGNLNKMKWLHMDFNSFSGDLPDSFYNMTMLKYCGFFSNKLQGKISSRINEMVALEFLFFGNNRFEGELPNFSNLQNLVVLALDGNNFSGSLPKIQGLPSLKELQLQGNNFSGELNTDYGELGSLIFFLMAKNGLNSKIPELYRNITNAVFWDLHDNQIYGSIPTFFKNLNKYKVDLSQNPFSCPIPEWAEYTGATCEEKKKNQTNLVLQNSKTQILDEDEKVNVKIFGMLKCPDMKDITNIFFDFFQKEGVFDIMDYSIEAIGTEDDTQPTSIYSMHGQTEALGSLWYICVNENYEQTVALEFLHCLNDNQIAIPENAEQCSNKLGIDYNQMLQCAISSNTMEKLVESTKISEKYNAIWSPTIYIENEFYCLWNSSPCKAKKSDDFLVDICKIYKDKGGKVPSGCL